MKLSEVGSRLPKELLESAAMRGVTTLTPPQESSLKNGLLEGKNLVVASPTASGKTFIAEMAMAKCVIHDMRKAVYVAPMRALVSEKYEDFKRDYPYLKIAMSIGDLDSLDHWLDGYDIVMASTEKLDSLIRHGVGWLDQIGCVVFDEIHMLDDSSRGPTLEILITKMRRVCNDAQIIALSATVGNAREIAEWLDAGLVESNYRPVTLEKGIALNGKVYYQGEEEDLKGTSQIPEIRVAQDTLHRRKQALVFLSTKRNAEASSERIGEAVEEMLTKEEKADLALLSDKVLHALPRPTAQCERLARVVAKGAAFHHGGLMNEQRRLIEDGFKENRLKVLCSTTTLGFGVNLPAHTVLVRDTSRYSDATGSEKLSVNEVTQLFGRAGRPKYDKEGRALLIAKSKGEILDLYARYIAGELEPITSKLGVLPVLRTHLLAFIATRMLRTKEGMLDFLGETLYGHQFGDSREMASLVTNILRELESWKFIQRTGSAYEPTRLGGRVSELYIDPLSAKWLIETLPRVTDDVSYLFMICNAVEMRPYVKATEEASELFFHYANLIENVEVHPEGSYAYYDPLKPLSTALMLRDWISEVQERDVVKKYNTTPGALFAKLNNSDWMFYASSELARLIKVSPVRLIELRMRAKYGIKRELLDLTRLEQVGRVRARLMFDAGITKVSDLRSEGSAAKVERLFGREIAKRIMEQVT
jgi:helicase